MATATAPVERPIRTTREVLDVTERNGERVYRYRWTVTGGPVDSDDPSGIAAAVERIEPLDRTLLEDRWRGLLPQNSDTTELQEDLDRVLVGLAEGLMRRTTDGHTVVNGDIVGIDSVVEIDDLELVIRDWLIERVRKVAAA